MNKRLFLPARRTYCLCRPALIFLTAALTVVALSALLWAAAVYALYAQGSAFANSQADILLSEGRLHLFLSLFEVLGGAILIQAEAHEQKTS